VRRTCYAFVTAAPVYPAVVNNDDSNQLFVKVLQLKQDGRDVIGVYAANFHGQPHKLDVSLPAPWSVPVTAQVFDEKAADWADAKEFAAEPKNGLLRIQAALPPGAPWCVFLYPPAGQVGRCFTPLAIPQPLAPWSNAKIVQSNPTLKWRPSAGADGTTKPASYEVQLAREMLFRPEDVITTQSGITAAEWKATMPLVADRRYPLARACNRSGRKLDRVVASPVVLVSAGQGALPCGCHDQGAGREAQDSSARSQHEAGAVHFGRDNLAHAGMPFSYPNYWGGGGQSR
jgi:hypothetical protein